MAAPGVTIKKQLLKLSNYVPTWVEGLGRNPRGVIFAPGAKISFLVHPRASRRPLLVGRGHGRYFVGTVTDHLGSQQAIQANLDAVVDVLKNAGIAHFVYGTAAGQHPVVGPWLNRGPGPSSGWRPDRGTWSNLARVESTI